MHVCQIMLIEADTAEEAIDYAKSTITYSETPYPAWSDWHGGLEGGLAGRWSGLFAGWEENRDVLQYTENPTLAEDIINDFLSNRLEQMNRFLKDVSTVDLEQMARDYDPYKGKFDEDGMKVWYLNRLTDILGNSWTSDSGVYDLTAHSANLEYYKERLAKQPEKQFLVPIDFHF